MKVKPNVLVACSHVTNHPATSWLEMQRQSFVLLVNVQYGQGLAGTAGAG